MADDCEDVVIEEVLSRAVKPELQAEWQEVVSVNDDAYGAATVAAAVRSLNGLAQGDTPERAESRWSGLGITGFMASCAAQMTARFSPRGEEFRRWWNLDKQIRDEGEKANERGGILNSAILNIGG